MSPTQLLHTLNFATPLEAAGWKRSTPKNPALLVTPPIELYPGQQAIHTAIRHPSHPQGPTNPGFRCEIDPTAGNPAWDFAHGQEYWVGFNLLLGESYATDDTGEVLAQFHSRPDNPSLPAPYNVAETWGEQGGPPICLRTYQGRFRLVVRYNPHHDPVTGTDPKQMKSRPVDIDPGIATPRDYRYRWLACAFHLSMSHQLGSGFTRLYLGDAVTGEFRLAAEIIGPNSYHGYYGPYLKLGIYKPLWKDGKPAENGVLERDQWHADVKIAGAGAGLHDVVTLAPDPGLAEADARLGPIVEVLARHYGLTAELRLHDRRGYCRSSRYPAGDSGHG